MEYLKNLYYRFQYSLNQKHIHIYKVRSIEETIEYITAHRVSVSRFGDGEFKWILGIKQNSFEVQSQELSRKLIEVIKSDHADHIVCVSPALSGLDYSLERAKKYWRVMLGSCWKDLGRYLDVNRVYYNANISRFYMNDVNKEKAGERFALLKQIWTDRKILIVEGELSKLGVGNDLFDSACSIRRIIAPSRNAFSKYEEIMKCVVENHFTDELVLLALGPTATVLAYCLSRENIQAIDIGHVDIEYEWFLRRSETKQPIAGKAVNEAVIDLSGESLPAEEEEIYLNQIIKKVI